MKKLTALLICFLVFAGAQAQVKEATLVPKEVNKDTLYPYVLPILGQKVAERGYEMQLPFGFNLNYTYNSMDLFVSEFGLNIGSDPTSTLNQLLDQYVTLETLNFQKVSATTNGVNVRADMWVLPFMNFYGIYAQNSGNTTVGLQPEWYDENGDLILSLPAFGSSVDFSAETWGIGTTLVYGAKNYFGSIDMNYSRSYSELLDDPAQLLVASARVGTMVNFKHPQRKMALYVGAMWRDFVESKGNYGQIKMNEVFPELGANVFPAINERVDANNNQIDANNNAIAGLNPNSPTYEFQKQQLENANNRLNTKNQALGKLDDAMQELVTAQIDYSIKKEIINNWSVQFGFNLQLNQHWMFRGEYGIANGNTFLLTGLQFRFGL
ncbi:MAG: hypothetical protein ACPGRE_10045 [Flavobacteriaceae bacterium]